VAYWLMKSEPDEFSIDRFAQVQQEEWSGVRNYQARNFIRSMQLGDEFLFYHSSCPEPGVVGVGKIDRLAAPDPTQFDSTSDYFDAKSKPDDPRWSSVLCGYVQHVPLISLERLRACAALEGFALLARGNRLSILPVDVKQWRAILQLASKKG
jgi:predicted RNA-binding protein with PUA-like domain